MTLNDLRHHLVDMRHTIGAFASVIILSGLLMFVAGQVVFVLVKGSSMGSYDGISPLIFDYYDQALINAVWLTIVAIGFLMWVWVLAEGYRRPIGPGPHPRVTGQDDWAATSRPHGFDLTLEGMRRHPSPMDIARSRYFFVS